MANVKKTNPVYQKIEGAIRRNPRISNAEIGAIEFGVASTAAVVYASQIRKDLGIEWDSSTRSFKIPESLLPTTRRRRTAQVEVAPVVTPAAPTQEVVTTAAVAPADRIKALLEDAQRSFAEAEARRAALSREMAAVEAEVDAQLRRIDVLTTVATLPENVWGVIGEIS